MAGMGEKPAMRSGPWSWIVRTQALTGQPFFSLQAFAEHAKDTRDWPLYSVYQQLEPQPLLQTITENPVPLMRKVARGVEFFLKDLGGFIPLPVVVIILVAMAVLIGCSAFFSASEAALFSLRAVDRRALAAGNSSGRTRPGVGQTRRSCR